MVMDPEDLISFDKLITPQYVQMLFWIGVVASVIGGLARIAAGLTGSYGSVVLVVWGLTIMLVGPVLVRVTCELLVLAFKLVDWIAEIKITLAKQQEELAAEQPPAHRREDSPSSSPAEASSSDVAASPPSSRTEG